LPRFGAQRPLLPLVLSGVVLEPVVPPMEPLPDPALPLGGGRAPELVLPAGSEDVVLLEVLFFSFLVVVVELSPDPP